MLDYQERVVEEKRELDFKITKLSNFVDSSKMKNVDLDEKGRLLNQLEIMENYSEVLGQRIDAFTI